MNKETKQAIATAVLNYMETTNASQADIARKTGVRKEYLVTILKEGSDFTYNAGKGKTGFIPVANFNKLADLVEYEYEKTYWEVQPTVQLTSMLSTLNDAKEYGATNVIIGDTGCGKTFTKELFAKRNPSDVFNVTIGSSDNIADIIDKTMSALSINSEARTKSKKLREIIKKLRYLKEAGYTPVIIYDEAEYMKQPALCNIKELYDHLLTYCSIILIGTPQLIANLETMRKRNKPGIPQLWRRLKFGVRMLPEIDRSYSLFLNDIDDKTLKSFLQRNCENYGELHDVMVPAMREADRLNESLTLPFVRTVLNLPETLYA